jgi:hypothetical protein
MSSKQDVTKQLAKVEADIVRWQRRVRRAVNAVTRLGKQKDRLLKRIATVVPVTAPRTEPVVTPAPKPPTPAVAPAAAASADRLDIPGFLQRTAEGKAKDDAAAAQIKADQAETAKRRKAGQDTRRKATNRGETRKMPLTGKAALAAIRAG